MVVARRRVCWNSGPRVWKRKRDCRHGDLARTVCMFYSLCIEFVMYMYLENKLKRETKRKTVYTVHCDGCVVQPRVTVGQPAIVVYWGVSAAVFCLVAF